MLWSSSPQESRLTSDSNWQPCSDDELCGRWPCLSVVEKCHCQPVLNWSATWMYTAWCIQ